MEMAEGKSSMAEKMDKKKKPAAPTTLPVSVEKKKKQHSRLVNLWTYFNAIIVVTISIGFAVVPYTFITHYASRASSWLVTKMTDYAEGPLASALATGMVWGSKTQVAVGVLMLLLVPCHRWRRVRLAAAYAALAVTVASQCMMYAATVLDFLRHAADPAGRLFVMLLVVNNTAIFIYSVGDLLVILRHFRGRED